MEPMNRTRIDMSLSNEQLYEGCEITIVAGRKVMVTPVHEAVHLLGRNAAALIAADENHEEVLLTGPMAVWAYLIVFHEVVHRYKRVWYDDGKNDPVLVAAHG